MNRRTLVSAFILPLSAFLLSGCLGLHQEPPQPGSTDDLGGREIVLPAKILDNTLIVEAKWDRSGPYHFLIDTGSSVTLVTQELADRYGARDVPLPDTPQVQVLSSDGQTTVLPAVVLRRIELGRARFKNVPALVYDCLPLAGQLCVKIDGVLGFPLFRAIQLTLDYPHGRVLLRPSESDAPPPEGSTLSFNNASKTPLVSLRIGDRAFIALVDSGSDETAQPQSARPRPEVRLRPDRGAPPSAPSPAIAPR